VSENTVAWCEMENYQKINAVTKNVKKSRVGLEENKER
jgi:hypothetical protein